MGKNHFFAKILYKALKNCPNGDISPDLVTLDAMHLETRKTSPTKLFAIKNQNEKMNNIGREILSQAKLILRTAWMGDL